MPFSREQTIFLGTVITPNGSSWETVEDVLTFLWNTPAARYQLLAEAHRRRQEVSRTFILRHNRLPLGLLLHPWGNDENLLHQIELRMRFENPREIVIPRITNFDSLINNFN